MFYNIERVEFRSIKCNEEEKYMYLLRNILYGFL